MRVLIDATALLLPGGGVKTYIHHWLEYLRRLARPPDEIHAFPFLNRIGGLEHERSPLGRAATRLRLSFVHVANIWGNPMLDALGRRYDVFHESNTQVQNPPRTARLTATIHDLTCWTVPETHTPRNILETKQFAERVLRRAERLIAISESTRQDAIRILGIAADRIDVIRPGVADEFFQAGEREAERVRGKYGLPRRYILSVGVLEPRKNFGTLLDAYGGLPEETRQAFPLVVAGPAGWRQDDLRARLEAGSGGVRYLGYAPEPDMPGLTAGATVFAYPSLYEGFGLPVAQAMAAGVPVLTSDVSSLPEVAGEAAVLVDPRSPGEIGAGLERLLSSDSLCARLGECGRRKAAEYRWAKAAEKSLAFFRAVAGG
jgi:alpha-1,3-rhamnosyl/mannosyltransferase